jgi:outer membrane immunogenic protein
MFTKQKLAIMLALSVGAFSTEALAGQWDGVFVGLNVGAARSSTKYQTGPDDRSWFKNAQQTAGMWAHGNQDEFRYSPIGGFSLAYNHQIDSFVLGAELGLNAIDAKLDHEGTYKYTTTASFYNPFNYAYQQKTSVKGLYTLRGRAGYAFGDSLLSVTGGLAATSLTTGVGFHDYADDSSPYSAAYTETKRKIGWTAGLTYQHMLPEDFVLKTEFAYVDLGKASLSTPVTQDSDGAYISQMNLSSRARLNVLTIGLEKKI